MPRRVVETSPARRRSPRWWEIVGWLSRNLEVMSQTQTGAFAAASSRSTWRRVGSAAARREESSRSSPALFTGAGSPFGGQQPSGRLSFLMAAEATPSHRRLSMIWAPARPGPLLYPAALLERDRRLPSGALHQATLVPP